MTSGMVEWRKVEGGGGVRGIKGEKVVERRQMGENKEEKGRGGGGGGRKN